MIVRFIGDVHGHYNGYRQILRASPHPTIQVGDLGIGFRHLGGPRDGEFMANPPHAAMILPPGHRFIRGNHDNPAVCRKHSQWIPDGTVEEGDRGPTMFIGGAVSIDRAFRTPGYSWWEDEELPYDTLLELIDKYAQIKPAVMVTHEAPEQIAKMIVHGQLDPRLSSRTRIAFEHMLSAHRPKVWIFGHWHVPFDKTVLGTRFICLPELATVDVNT